MSIKTSIISPQDISHVLKHPLSILIHLQYQDAIGCSINGWREFLYSVGIVDSDQKLWSFVHSYFFQDERGCPIYMKLLPDIPAQQIPVSILNFKKCSVRFNKNPSIPGEGLDYELQSYFIDEEERKLIMNLIDHCNTDSIDGRMIVDRFPQKITEFSLVHNHITAFHPDAMEFNVDSDFFDSLSQLPFLRFVNLDISEIVDDKENLIQPIQQLTQVSGLRFNFTNKENNESLHHDLNGLVDCIGNPQLTNITLLHFGIPFQSFSSSSSLMILPYIPNIYIGFGISNPYLESDALSNLVNLNYLRFEGIEFDGFLLIVFF